MERFCLESMHQSEWKYDRIYRVHDITKIIIYVNNKLITIFPQENGDLVN